MNIRTIINRFKVVSLNKNSYIYSNIMKKIILTFQEWRNSLRVPTPVRNRKKYTRKDKHKNKSYE